MKKLLTHSIGASLSLILLNGCDTQRPPLPQLPASLEQQQCLQTCLDLQDHCVKQYEALYQQCVVQKNQQAKLDYQAYLKRQTETQQKTEKKQSDFLDLASCKQQLDCPRIYEKCYDNCDL